MATSYVGAILQNAAAATAVGNSLNVHGYSSVSFQITGTFVGTVTFEGTVNGSDWVSLDVVPIDGTSVVTTATATGIWTGSCAGLSLVRANVTGWTSGDITVRAQTSESGGGAGSSGGGGGGGGGDASAANQTSGLTRLGSVTETAPATDTASSGLNGRLQRIAQRLTTTIGLLPVALGSGGGLKVDGSGTALPVSGTVAVTDLGALTETAPATDTASSGLNGRLQRIAQRLSSIILLIPTALGAGGGLKVDGSGTALPVSGTITVTGVATSANQTTELTDLGGVTETAPATDTASSGLNGRLQRIAQRLTTMIGLLPTALGTSGGLKVDGSGTSLPTASTVADGADVALGAKSDAEETSGTGGSLLAISRRSRTLLASLAGKILDYDTTAGTDNVVAVGLAIPGSGGAVAAGTSSNPLGVTMTTGLNITDDAVGVTGILAHDAVDTGAPIKIGGQARTTNPTAVADADRVNAIFDKIGRLVVAVGQVRDLRGSARVALTDATETTVVAAAASVFHDVRAIVIANGSTTDVDVDIRDDTAGTVRSTFSVKAGTTSGIALPSSTPQTAVNKNWTAQCSSSPTGGTAQVAVTIYYETNI